MRVRITFSKTGPLIYIGNLDLYTMWERAARRAGLPLAYSHGFHPQPKVHFASPLPLGYSSRCEILDMRLDQDVELDTLPAHLNAVLPAGIRVLDAEVVGDGSPAVQTQVLSADYEVRLEDAVPRTSLQSRIEALLGAASLPRVRRERHYDLRPLIERLTLERPGDPKVVLLRMTLRAQEGATGRPDEVVEALGIPREQARIERTALHLAPAAERANPPDEAV